MDNKYSLEDLEKLLKLLHEVEKVKRVARRPDEKERTSTAEHTFELAIFCWYISKVNNLDLDLGQVLKFALAHDIVEAYAGDTPIHDEEAKKTKVVREVAALERIKKEFPEFPDLTETLHEYEKRETREAKFVYAADKLIDPLNISMETTQSFWKELDISFENLVRVKKDKIAFSDTIVEYWKKLVQKIESKKDFYFNKKY